MHCEEVDLCGKGCKCIVYQLSLLENSIEIEYHISDVCITNPTILVRCRSIILWILTLHSIQNMCVCATLKLNANFWHTLVIIYYFGVCWPHYWYMFTLTLKSILWAHNLIKILKSNNKLLCTITRVCKWSDRCVVKHTISTILTRDYD